MTAELNQLSPGEMAAQLGRPTGKVAVAVGDYMSRLNARLIGAAFELLAPTSDSRILEVGFGNGMLISELLASTPRTTYTGVEISQPMIREAKEHNRDLIRQGRVHLHCASVERLPFPDTAFDRAVAINAIYFWPDQVGALAEIRRCLRAGGLLVVASMTRETAERSPAAKKEFGFNVPSRDALELMHRRAGFRDVRLERYEEEAERLDGSRFSRAYDIVRAQAD